VRPRNDPTAKSKGGYYHPVLWSVNERSSETPLLAPYLWAFGAIG
jgi:hypothetical protein